MIKLKDLLREDNKKQQKINEIFPFVIGAVVGSYTKTQPKDKSVVKKLKDKYTKWKDDLKLKKIADKLKGDRVIQAMMKSPHAGEGWKSVVKSKLSGDEIKYLDKLTKTYLR